MDPLTIVVEVSKNWPNDDTTPIAKLFEDVIGVNLKRGYVLIDWRFSASLIQLHSGDQRRLETIIAVFERVKRQPGPPMPLGTRR